MPTISPPAPTGERRTAVRDARLQRALRISQLRRQVLAAALSVFAVAFGFVAFDGSMGTGRTASAAAPASSPQTSTDAFGGSTSSVPPASAFDGASSPDGSSSSLPAQQPAPVQTSQS
jgi:hypothetical protein